MKILIIKNPKQLNNPIQDNSILLFDGVCNLCNGAVQYVIRRDKENKFRFAPMQSNAGTLLLHKFGIPENKLHSFVLIQTNEAFTKSTAALMVARQLSGPVKLLYGFIIVPRVIRDWVYMLIANNRYKWFGKKESCMIPPPEIQSKFLN